MESTILESINSKSMMLNDVIDYSSESIVSKTLVKNRGGSSIIFAFDKGLGLTEHTSPVDALVQIVEGEAVITIGGIENKISQGGIIIMPANIPHAVKAVTSMKMLLVMLKVNPE